VRVAKAIAHAETGNQQTRGRSGEFGALQFLPHTWKCVSNKVTGRVIEQTKTNELWVSAKYIERFIGRLSVEEIGRVWHSSLCGENEPREVSGINEHGVRYNSSRHGKRVERAYKSLDGYSYTR